MKIIYKICDIPGLSWLAELTINHEDIIVYVGKMLNAISNVLFLAFGMAILIIQT